MIDLFYVRFLTLFSFIFSLLFENSFLFLCLINNRLSFSFTSYKQKTEDAILEFPVAPSTGFAYELKNAATIQNNGIEISIDANLYENSSHNSCFV